MKNKKKIIYLIGPGRSGTTLFGLLLSNFNSYLYVGELSHWTHFKGIPTSSDEDNLKFWLKIKKRVKKADKYIEVDFHKYFEHYYSLLYPLKFLSSKLRLEYYNYINELYDSIFSESKCKVIIDSSHYPFRAYWLKKLSNLDVKIIYLTRNPIKIINSFQKENIEQQPKGVLIANFYLFFANFFTLLIYYLYPKERRMKIKYEDLIENTNQILEDLSKFVNYDYSINNIDINNLNNSNFVFEGNRLRKKQNIRIEKKTDKNFLSSFDVLLTKILQFPFYKVNGYKLNNFTNGKSNI